MSQFSHCPAALPDHLLRVAPKPPPSPPGQDSTDAIEVWGDGGEIKESLNAPQRLHPLKDNLKVIEQAGINCRTMPVVSL